MKKILVTGGCGFIGSNFINFFLKTCDDVHIINIDKLDYCAREDNIKETRMYTFIKCDICDYDGVLRILKEYDIDTVIHFAAQTHVDNSFVDSLAFTRDNTYGTHVLIEACRVYGCITKFIHISTDEVYGEVSLDSPGLDEKSLLNPTNPYSASKAGAEFIIKSYYYSFKMPVIICRCNNVYGPNQYEEKVIPKFINQLLKGEKCTIHGNGQSRRNFIHADDVSRALECILNHGKINHTYNIGDDSNEMSVLDIVNKLVDIIYPGDCITKWVTFVEDRHFNDFRYSIDNTKLMNLGWKPLMDLNKELKCLVNNGYIHRL